MRLITILEGTKFTIKAIDLANEPGEENCPAKDFLDSLPSASHKAMMGVLNLHVQIGPIYNDRKSRLLSDGIFEFKNRQGDRIAYYYPSGERYSTVLTHGFKKGDKLKVEVQKALTLRSQYYGLKE